MLETMALNMGEQPIKRNVVMVVLLMTNNDKII